MSVVDVAVELLKREEGFRAKPYLDSLGVETIGYGRNLRDTGISEAEAAFLLRNDVLHALDVLNEYPWFQMLDEVRMAVLVNMAVNLGVGGLLGFHDMVQAIAGQGWKDAARAMLDSKWAGQVKARAGRLAAMMETGVRR